MKHGDDFDFDARFKRLMDAFDRAEKERLRSAAEFDRRMAEADKRAAEADKRAADLDRRIQKVSDQIGGFTNNYGEALDDEFAAGLREKGRIGGVPLDDVGQRVRFNKNRAEFDIVAMNCDFVFVGEIKNKFLPADVARFAKDRLPRFAEEFPWLAKGRKLLGMIGGGAITGDAQKEAEKRGLIILRLRNRKIVVENADNARPATQPG